LNKESTKYPQNFFQNKRSSCRGFSPKFLFQINENFIPNYITRSFLKISIVLILNFFQIKRRTLFQIETDTSPALLCILGSCRTSQAAAATAPVSVRLLRTLVPAASQQNETACRLEQQRHQLEKNSVLPCPVTEWRIRSD
jgi:hypothetical protein